MTFEIRQLIESRIAVGDDNAAIIAAVEASEVGYVDVPAISIAQWLGANALREKIDQFLARELPAKTDPLYGTTLAIRAGLKQLLVAQTNPDARLGVAPGTGNRQLVDVALQFGILDQSDLEGLMARARPGYVSPTNEEIDQVRDALAALAAQEARQVIAAAEVAKANAYIGAMESWHVNGGEMPTWEVA